jgi:hypothetical protein
MVQLTLVSPVDFTVIANETVIVPPNVVRASVVSSAAGTGRNAPVLGSRYPKMPGLAELFAVWPQTAGATVRQHMQINNSFVILISSPVLEIQIVFLDPFYSGESDTGWGGPGIFGTV